MIVSASSFIVALIACLLPIGMFAKVCALLLVGLAYGLNWVVMPSHLGTEFGTNNQGVLFNICTSGMAVAVYFMSHFTGAAYDAAKEAQNVTNKGAEFCEGLQCFGTSFSIGLGFSTCALLVGVSMLIRSRKFSMEPDVV